MYLNVPPNVTTESFAFHPHSVFKFDTTRSKNIVFPNSINGWYVKWACTVLFARYELKFCIQFRRMSVFRLFSSSQPRSLRLCSLRSDAVDSTDLFLRSGLATWQTTGQIGPYCCIKSDGVYEVFNGKVSGPTEQCHTCKTSRSPVSSFFVVRSFQKENFLKRCASRK